MKRRPLILVSPSTEARGSEFADASVSLSNRYPAAVLAAGGVPVIIPCITDKAAIAEAIARCDGVLLTGGDDMHWDFYEPDLPENIRKTVSLVVPERDLLELEMINQIFRMKKPLLAICRGHQVLNVALGGTLISDIPLQVPGALKHQRSDATRNLVHRVDVKPGSILAKYADGKSMSVNSSHHQAVGRVAEPLLVTGTSPDGVIEALELKPERSGWLPYLLAVQFHPERLFDRYGNFLEMFRGFIQACEAGMDPAP
jgi:putative glutamine amidotransferase